MTEEKKFTHLLNSDSPKLHGELKRLFGSIETTSFEKLYHQRCQIFPIEETGINRTVGANYNPKVCRILLLQVRDAWVKNINTFKASLFIDLKKDLLININSTQLEKIAEISIDLIEKLNQNNIDESYESLVFASLLDEVRHTHLLAVKNEERLEEIHQFLIQNKVTKNEKLHSKCMHALKLQGVKI